MGLTASLRKEILDSTVEILDEVFRWNAYGARALAGMLERDLLGDGSSLESFEKVGFRDQWSFSPQHSQWMMITSAQFAVPGVITRLSSVHSSRSIDRLNDLCFVKGRLIDRTFSH